MYDDTDPAGSAQRFLTFVANGVIKSAMAELDKIPDEEREKLDTDVGDVVSKDKLDKVYDTVKTLLSRGKKQVQIYDKNMKAIVTANDMKTAMDELTKLIREGKAYYVGDEFQIVTIKKGTSSENALGLMAQSLQLLNAGRLKETDRNELRYTLRDMEERGMTDEDAKKFAKMVVDKSITSETKDVKSKFKLAKYSPTDLDKWRTLYKAKKQKSK
jgi:chaperonin cofactor prefoldin